VLICDQESVVKRIMTTPRVRPTFEIEVDLDPKLLMERLRGRLPACAGCVGMSVGLHAELFVPENERRVWSPWLSVTARGSNRGTVVRCRFAPHPNIWTLSLFLVFGLGFALLVGLTWGYAQWAMETTPWALLSAPLVAVALLALFAISLIGQRLGASQMVQLRDAVHELVS
jgi:hypothetical protein